MSSMSEARRSWAAHLEQRANLPFLCMFVLLRFSMDLTMPAHKGEGTFCTHHPNPVLVSSRNTLTVTPANGVSPAVWASLSSGKLTHKSNHHSHPTINSGAVALQVLFCFYDFFFCLKWIEEWNYFFINLLQVSERRLIDLEEQITSLWKWHCRKKLNWHGKMDLNYRIN